MRAIIQRVKYARVEVENKVVGEIGNGILTLLGVADGDQTKDVEWMIQKIVGLRIFEDDAGKMNLSLKDKGFAHLIVSQFTLYGDCKKGNRPSFTGAARPEVAQPLYNEAIRLSASLGVTTAGGQFQADMKVSLLNDGPVTFMLET